MAEVDYDNFWVDAVKDNRIKGLLSEIQLAIDECEDERILWQAGKAFRLGFSNRCDRRREQLKEQENGK